MARRTTKTTKTIKPEPLEDEVQTRNSLFDYLRFGESYTSLILGIIVVIISTVLLLSFVHNRNILKNDTPQLLSQRDIALPSIAGITGGPEDEQETAPTIAPTRIPEPTKKVEEPTPTPTKKVEPTKAAEPTKVVAVAKPSPASALIKKEEQGNTKPTKGEYTVAAGDNLWSIAEKQYKSGYNWVDIARANKLSNPGAITVGQKLKLPQVEQKIATVQVESVTQGSSVAPTNKITGDSYTIVKGDTLWDIAVRAYNDGYQWKKIASANNLVNPSLIHSGNKLKIPQGK